MRDSSTTVEVAKGQIRQGRLRYQSEAVPYVVLAADTSTATIRQIGRESTAGITVEDLRRWPCIGIETDHGRVMVGERRTMVRQGSANGCVAIIVRVIDDIGVEVEGRGHYTAATVATWPLLPSFAEAAKDAVRAPITVLSSESDYQAAAKRIAESTPASYDAALHLVMYHRSEEAARLAIGCAVVGGRPPPARPAVSFGGMTITAQEVRGMGGHVIGKTRGTYSGECVITLAPPKPDPRAEREARRREIDRILREDARKHPAFATARKCAVMARLEGAPPFPPEDLATIGVMCAMLKWLREYEEKRGGMRAPSPAARNFALATFGEVVMGVYERSRALP